MKTTNEVPWVEKYRPKTIDECILPEPLKVTFRQLVISKSIPNLPICGPTGVGKKSTCRAMLNSFDTSLHWIDCSLDGNIATLRENASGGTLAPLFGKISVIVLEQADALTAATQTALRGIIEGSRDRIFILICNVPKRIIEPLRSHFSEITFDVTEELRPKLIEEFRRHAHGILKAEQIEYDESGVRDLFEKHAPDWRRAINELQRHSISGTLTKKPDVSFRV